MVYPQRWVSLKEVAAKQRLSVKYLEQIMSVLKAAGLVRSVRGTSGGYELARPPAAIRLSEVYAVLDGSAAPLECVEHPGACPMEAVCPTKDTWVEVKDAVNAVLDRTSLQDLAERRARKVAAIAPTYDI